MSPLQNLLSRLNRVSDRGRGKYAAACPGPVHEHGDRHPSLSVREVDDGVVLLKCWAGCSIYDIADAVGIKVRDLFPNGHADRRRYDDSRHAWNDRDLLYLIRRELCVILTTYARVIDGQPLSSADMERVHLTIERLNRVLEVTREH